MSTNRLQRCLIASIGLSVLLFSPETTIGGDWPQILGPQRSGVAEDERLNERWPAEGPQILWSRPAGQGSAGVAVVGDAAVLFHRRGDDETVEALDVASGEPRWTMSYPTDFASQYGSDDGPLCVPTVSGQHVITFGPQGTLSCWGLKSGALQWRRETHKDFEAREGYFGAGSCPLVVGDRVIVNVGGIRGGSGVVAFDLTTGKDVWAATDERPSYAAPTLAEFEGRSIILCVARLSCLGLDPGTGEVLFEIPFGRRGTTVNAATPVVLGQTFLLTASYGVGAVLCRFTQGGGAEEVWRKADILSSQYTTPVAYEGVLFGIDGRDDLPPAHLRCIDPTSGRVLWSEDDFGYATLLRAGDKLIIARTNGELILARASRERFEPLGRHRLTSQTLRALPALSGGRLYLRDTQRLYCVDVGTP